MTITRSVPLSWFPQSLSDCEDSTPVFPGAMNSLQNLIPDPRTKNVWLCRPAAIMAVDFSKSGGSFSTAFSTAFDVGLTGPAEFISCLKVVGTRAYGMVSSSAYAGFDIPFSYNIVTGMFEIVAGITAANIPTSPASSGAWVPPTMDVVGVKVVVTHPGFDTTNGYFGLIDISNPASPSWSSGNTATTTLPAVPVAVKQFNGRAYYAVNPATGQPGTYWSDALDPGTITNGTQVITYGDNIPITAFGALPLNNQLGGIIQSLMVFKGVTNIYQVTGDNMTLSVNSLNVATGTLAPNAICATPKGLMFMAPDGFRLIDFNAHVSDPIGISGSGMTTPFIYAVVPSRVAAACNMGVVRISVQDGSDPGNPNEEYWYDMMRQLWTGPHTFPASLIQPYSNTFIMAPVGVLSKLFQSDCVQSSTSTFTENGTALAFVFKTALLPNTGKIASNYISETTIDMALASGASYSVSALGPQSTVIDTVSINAASGSSTQWGSFTWGSATWGSSVSNIAPNKVQWTLPIVTDQMYIQMTGQCAQGVKLGKCYMRYSILGYLANAA